MTSRRLFIGKILTLAAAVPLLCSAEQACCAASKEEKTDEKKTCSPKLVATGATLVECGEKKTKLAIKCAKCGYKATLEIDTPTADQPYTLEWKCPKCGNKQNIKVEVAKAE
jgi:DNA-directed RNA polymerase subunit M/transcription elongation factor TFIIS